MSKIFHHIFRFFFQTLIRDERFMNKALISGNDTLIMSALKSVSILPVIRAPIQCRILTVNCIFSVLQY